MTNWKTDITGIAAVLLGLSHLVTHLMTGDTTMSVIWGDFGSIVAGAGLIFAKDATAK